MEELAGQASLRDAGIATDKLLALSSDPFSQANNQLHVHLEAVDLVGQWNKMLETLNLKSPPTTDASETKATATKALPSGPDKEAKQSTATIQPAEDCAREEKTAQKELTGVDRSAQGVNSKDSTPVAGDPLPIRRSDCEVNRFAEWTRKSAR